jgi:aspartate carbamoyltransferase catalytic subunit
MSLTEEFKQELRNLNLRFEEPETAEEALANADVIYMEPVVQADYTRSRVESEEERDRTPPAYRVTREMLRDKAKPDAIVLHSLPRMDELPTDVDDTRHARYWYEAYNGVVVRMALLALVLGAVE